jgi:hypothetical protein
MKGLFVVLGATGTQVSLQPRQFERDLTNLGRLCDRSDEEPVSRIKDSRGNSRWTVELITRLSADGSRSR